MGQLLVVVKKIMGTQGIVAGVLSFVVTTMYWVCFLYNDFRWTSFGIPGLSASQCGGQGSAPTGSGNIYLSWGYWGYCITPDSGGFSDDNMKCIRYAFGKANLGWESNYDSSCLSYYDSSLGLGPDQWVPYGFGLTALILLTCGACSAYPACCIGDEHAKSALGSAASFTNCAATCILVAIACETAFNNRGGMVRATGPEANDIRAGYAFIGSWICWVLAMVVGCICGSAAKSCHDACGESHDDCCDDNTAKV